MSVAKRHRRRHSPAPRAAAGAWASTLLYDGVEGQLASRLVGQVPCSGLAAHPQRTVRR